MECEFCGRSLDNGVLVLPWEDGNNPTAYYILTDNPARIDKIRIMAHVLCFDIRNIVH